MNDRARPPVWTRTNPSARRICGVLPAPGERPDRDVPHVVEQIADRGADVVGEVEPDGVLQAAGGHPGEEGVGASPGVGIGGSGRLCT
jgi:hypothetical protein